MIGLKKGRQDREGKERHRNKREKESQEGYDEDTPARPSFGEI